MNTAQLTLYQFWGFRRTIYFANQQISMLRSRVMVALRRLKLPQSVCRHGQIVSFSTERIRFAPVFQQSVDVSLWIWAGTDKDHLGKFLRMKQGDHHECGIINQMLDHPVTIVMAKQVPTQVGVGGVKIQHQERSHDPIHAPCSTTPTRKVPLVSWTRKWSGLPRNPVALMPATGRESMEQRRTQAVSVIGAKNERLTSYRSALGA